MSGKRRFSSAISLLIVVLIIAACGGGPRKLWAGSIVRDIDTTGGDYKVVYQNEGSSTETQKVDIFTQNGAWNLGKLSFEKAGNQLREYLQLAGLRSWENYNLMTSEEQSENVLDVTKSKFALLRWVTSAGVPFQASKNELSFSYPALFQDPLRYQSVYKIPTDLNGIPDFTEAKNWYDVMIGDNILGDKWSPYEAVIENSMVGRSLHANWAQSNESFDAAMEVVHQEMQSLADKGWVNIDPKYGRLKMVMFNPNNVLELLTFENPFEGKVWTDDGKVVTFRVVPQYVVLDGNLYFGPAKVNSTNATLRSLLWQVEDATATDGWRTVAGMHFLKGRFQANSLYVFKVYHSGEDPNETVANLMKELDADIPEDVLKLMYSPITEGSAEVQLVQNWVASRGTFDLKNLISKYELAAAAVVRYEDISDHIWVLEPCGKDCSHYVDKVTTPRKQLTWNIAVGPNGIEIVNHMLTLGSESMAKAFEIGYVQPGAGDGLSYIFGALRSTEREAAGKAGYPEAIRLDLRAPVDPQSIDVAAHVILLQDR